VRADFGVARIHLAALLYQQGRYREALRECGTFLATAKSAGEKARGYYFAGLVLQRQGHLAEARAAAQRELALVLENAQLTAPLDLNAGATEHAKALVAQLPTAGALFPGLFPALPASPPA